MNEIAQHMLSIRGKAKQILELAKQEVELIILRERLMREFIYRPEFETLKEKLEEVKTEIEKSSFNIFSISSVNSHKENYHSDILALLLDPSEKHGGGEIYLNLFLDFLINSYKVSIDKNNYCDVEIKKENPTDSMDLKGRIDILIRDANSKRCIIIENKINNAGDTQNQLEKYYINETKLGYAVDSIVYLPLNQKKKAPLTNNDVINRLIINVPAFANKADDLYSGWILPCYRANVNESATSFIYEYSKLLKHLSQMGLDRDIKDEFYQIISEKEGVNRVQSIVKLNDGLNEYRADIFIEKLNGNYEPFKKIYRWRPYYWLFENYFDDGIKYKLDVQFLPNEVRIDFWNPDCNADESDVIKNKLQQLGILNDFFEFGFGNGMYKIFTLQEDQGIKDLDKEVLVYIQCFLKELKSK